MSFVFYTSFVFYPHFKSVFLAFGVRSKRRLVKTLATNSLSTFMQCAHSAFGSAQVMSVAAFSAMMWSMTPTIPESVVFAQMA